MDHRLIYAHCWLLIFAVVRMSGALPPNQPERDACSLLTSNEIKAVQGEAVKETKATTRQPGGGILVSQCVFVTPTAAKSVSVMLTTPEPAAPSGTSARDLWRKQFASVNGKVEKEPKSSKTSKSEEKDAENERRKPQPVIGLGDQAFWMGSRIGGALYVLRGNSFARISIGGEKTESVRIQKSKTLAGALLKRM